MSPPVPPSSPVSVSPFPSPPFPSSSVVPAVLVLSILSSTIAFSTASIFFAVLPLRRSQSRRSPLRRSPLRRSPLRRSPLRRSPPRRSPVSPFSSSPFSVSPFSSSPFSSSPFSPPHSSLLSILCPPPILFLSILIIVHSLPLHSPPIPILFRRLRFSCHHFRSSRTVRRFVLPTVNLRLPVNIPVAESSSVETTYSYSPGSRSSVSIPLTRSVLDSPLSSTTSWSLISSPSKRSRPSACQPLGRRFRSLRRGRTAPLG